MALNELLVTIIDANKTRRLPQGTQRSLLMYFPVYMLPSIKYYFITTNQETIWVTLSTAAATGSALARFKPYLFDHPNPTNAIIS